MIRCSFVVRIIAGVVYGYGKTGALSRRARLLDRRVARKNCPPARAVERLIVRFWGLLQSAPFKEFARGVRKLRQQAVLLSDTIAIFDRGRVGHCRAGCQSIWRSARNV